MRDGSGVYLLFFLLPCSLIPLILFLSFLSSLVGLRRWNLWWRGCKSTRMTVTNP
uniref:Uncharacterized protein n=1 Tax=Arundo donax TaxID=35708 RepID=A0A0A8YML7_ARUDO